MNIRAQLAFFFLFSAGPQPRDNTTPVQVEPSHLNLTFKDTPRGVLPPKGVFPRLSGLMSQLPKERISQTGQQ